MDAIDEFLAYALGKEALFRIKSEQPTQLTYSRRRSSYFITLAFQCDLEMGPTDYRSRKIVFERVAGEDGRTYRSVEVTVKNPETGEWAAINMGVMDGALLGDWLRHAFMFLGIPTDYAPSKAERKRLDAASHRLSARGNPSEIGPCP